MTQTKKMLIRGLSGTLFAFSGFYLVLPKFFHFGSEELQGYVKAIAVVLIYYAGWLMKYTEGSIFLSRLFKRKRKTNE